MAINVNITVDDGGLLERALQLQEANRQALLDRLAAQELERKALDQRVAEALTQARDGAVPEFETVQRPAASLMPSTLVAVCHVGQISPNTFDTAFCGNYAESIELPGLTTLPGGTYATADNVPGDETYQMYEGIMNHAVIDGARIFFPVSGQTGIMYKWVRRKSVRVTWDTQTGPPGSERDDVSATDPVTEEYEYAFVVNKTGIRALTVPTLLSEMVHGYITPTGYTPFSSSNFNGAGVSTEGEPVYSGNVDTGFWPNTDLDLDLHDVGIYPNFGNNNLSYAAGVFKGVQDYATIPPPGSSLDDVLTFLDGEPIPLRGVDLCGRDSTCNLTGVDGRYFIGHDIVSNPYVVQTDDDALPVYIPNLASRINYTMAPVATIYTTWDWGRPGYCRTKLLELGFTSEDFIP